MSSIKQVSINFQNFIARKRSLGQGNVFASVCVCQSFCSQGEEGLCMMSLPVWPSGSTFLLEGLCLWSHFPSDGVSV